MTVCVEPINCRSFDDIVRELVAPGVGVTADKKAEFGVTDTALVRKVPQFWPLKIFVTPSFMVKAFITASLCPI